MKIKRVKFTIIASIVAIMSIINFGHPEANNRLNTNLTSLLKTANAGTEIIVGDLCMHGLPSYCIFFDDDMWPIYIVDPGDWI